MSRAILNLNSRFSDLEKKIKLAISRDLELRFVHHAKYIIMFAY